MLVDLDRDLPLAARDDHDPTRLDAGHLTGALARASRRRATRWLVGALALALVVGFLAWYRPRLGPAPAPSPTPTPEWSWDPTVEPLSMPLSTEVALRRCPARPGERFVPQSSIQRPGGYLVFERAGASATTAARRTCWLGYQQAPDDPAPTTAELSTDDAGLLAACRRHTGFTFDTRSWHVIATTGIHVLGDSYPGPRRTVALVGDDGWQVTCTLAGPPYGSALVFQRVREAAAAYCPAITVFSTHDDSAAWAAALDGRAPTQTLRTLAVDGSWVVPSLDHRPDTRVASIDVRIGTPANLAAGRFPVHSGFAAGYGAVHLPRPVDWDGNQAIPVEVVLRDARGHELRRCST